MSDGYLRNREFYGDDGGDLTVTAATDDTTLITCKAAHTIFVQRAKVGVTTASATTWNLKDSTGLSISGALSANSAPTQYPLDYGPRGKALTPGANFVLDVGAVGAAGLVTWEAFQKYTG